MTTRVAGRKKSTFDYATFFREIRFLHDLTTLPEEKTWQSVPPIKPEPHKVVLYLGCRVLMTAHLIRTVTDIFDLLGVDYVAVGGPAYCCGIVHNRNGDADIAQTMGRNAVRHFESFEPERVVMWCPACIYYYDEIFQTPASFQTQHVTEFLVDHLQEMKFVQEVPQRVALHSHSDRPRRLREAEAAETLLKAVPGLKYVALESDVRLGQTCPPGAAGAEAWKQIVEGQLHRAVEAEADIFANIYHGCQRSICIYEEKYPITIEHYLSVLGRALGIEDYEDKYKKYRLWQNPELVLADMSPCMQASNVGVDAARRVVLQTFPSK